eukprot:tig00021572_g22396.t1
MLARAGFTVTIGTAPCVVTDAREEYIACTLGAGEAGSWPIQVAMDNIGLALQPSPARNFTYSLTIKPSGILQPSGTLTMVGSQFGGATFTVNGEGLSKKAVVSMTGTSPAAAVGVKRTASVLSATTKQLTFILPASPGATAATVDISTNFVFSISISVNGLTANTPSTFTYNYLSTPLVDHSTAAIAPKQARAGDTVTLKGSQFGTNYTYLVANALLYVGSASTPLTASSALSGTLVFTMQPVARAGSGQALALLLPFRGLAYFPSAYSDGKINVLLELASAFPLASPFAGGMSLTLVGSGFDDVNTTVTVCGISCPVSSGNASTLICMTGSLKPTDSEYNSSANCPIKLSVAARGGVGANTTTFYPGFAYSNSAGAPTITSISPSRGSTAGGTRITMIGSGLVGYDGSWPTSITLTNCLIPCDVQSANDTVIVCRARSGCTNGTAAAPAVLVPGKG